MGVEHETIVVCRGRALLCPLNPGKADIIYIGRREPRPYGKSSFTHNENTGLPVQAFLQGHFSGPHAMSCHYSFPISL